MPILIKYSVQMHSYDNNPPTFEVPLSVQKELGELYSRYTSELKPVLSMVECWMLEFPGPILNEIRAMNDHVSRCFFEEKSEKEKLGEIKKATGHLTRAILDCYKCMLIVSEKKINNFFEQYKDVCIALVNDGKFLPRLNELHRIAKELAIKARKKESLSFPNKEAAYEEYEQAINSYNEIDRYIEENSEGLSNATQFAKDKSKESHKYSILSAIYGTIFGTIVTLLIYHWEKIVSWILSL